MVTSRTVVIHKKYIKFVSCKQVYKSVNWNNNLMEPSSKTGLAKKESFK